MTKIRVLVADDQMLVRQGFSVLLNAEPDIAVVGQAVDGRDAVAKVAELKPDVVLMDIRMPVVDGIEATRRITEPADAAVKVLILTTFDLDEYVYGALRAGACGFLLKDSGPTLLIEAVRAAAVGDSLVSPSVTVRLLKHLATPAASQAKPAREPLTEREMDVVRLVARGRTNQEVAAELFVSLSTVKTHLGSIQAKLGARNRVEIAAWAWESGLVS